MPLTAWARKNGVGTPDSKHPTRLPKKKDSSRTAWTAGRSGRIPATHSKVAGNKINIQKSFVFLCANDELSEIKKTIPFMVVS